ncbi:MAG: chemotaxis protein CheD [Clostridia bacterium]|nr:chemotaxis protein CheD [Clostridia bacterium]
MSQVIKVGMADLKASKEPINLITSGLGSCVGICIFDANSKIGGLAHIMLPSSKGVRQSDNKAKFADTAVNVLIADMIKLGAKRGKMTAKIAGGSQMFNFKGTSDVMRIGERNIEASKQALMEANIPILSEDCGGNFGRTIILDTKSGNLLIRTIQHGEKII